MYRFSLRTFFVHPVAWLGLWLVIATLLLWSFGAVSSLADDLRQPLEQMLVLEPR